MKLAVGAVKYCEGIHSVEPLQQTFDSPFRKSVSQHFRIAPALERVAMLFQLPAQLAIIVNLAILKNDDLTFAAEERLSAAFNVNDREPSHSHPDRAVEIMPFAVGAALDHRVAHGGEQLRRHVTGNCINQSDYAAHYRDLPLNHASRKIFP